MVQRLVTDIDALDLMLQDWSDDEDNMLPVSGVDAEDGSSESDVDPSMAARLSSELSEESEDEEGLLAVTMDARSRSSSRGHKVYYSIKWFRCRAHPSEDGRPSKQSLETAFDADLNLDSDLNLDRDYMND